MKLFHALLLASALFTAPAALACGGCCPPDDCDCPDCPDGCHDDDGDGNCDDCGCPCCDDGGCALPVE
jgi:hypothetical protein